MTAVLPRSEISHRFYLMKKQMMDEGLFEKQVHKFWLEFALTAGGWFATITTVVLCDEFLVCTVLLGVTLGVVQARLGFLVHEIGHHQVEVHKKLRFVVNVFAGVFMCISFDWWTAKHNKHHAFPNQEGRDPDITSTVLAFSIAQAQAVTFAPKRVWLKLQAFLYFPMLAFEGLNLQFTGIAHVVKGVPRRACLIEATAMALFLTLQIWLVAHLGLLNAAVFIVSSLVAFGVYLGISFAPNHKGMPILEKNDSSFFISHQILTSRNVSGGCFTSWLFAGLNLQVEHHLFPSMPRENLLRAKPMVEAFCNDVGLPYSECSWAKSLRLVITHLSGVARA